MRSHRARTTLLWIATLAILWSLLAPSIAQSAEARQGKTWIEVCSVSGTKLVALDDAASETQQRHGGEHCAYCLSPQTDLSALCQPGLVRLVAAAWRGTLQVRAFDPPAVNAIWSPHASRGPPHLS